MQNSRRVLITCVMVNLLILSSGVQAQESGLPDQKLLVALTSVNYTRQTVTASESGSVPFGFAAEYSLFVSRSTSLFGQFEINFDTASQSVVFLGGGAGIAWYFIGGSNYSYNGTFIESLAKPNSNLYFGLGLASRSYDFLLIEKEQKTSGSIVKRDKKDKTTGSFLGIQAALAYEYPMSYDLLPGVRVQYVKSFTSETEPSFLLLEIWFSVGFVF